MWKGSMFLTALVLIGLLGPLEGPACGSSDALTSWSGPDSSSGIRSYCSNVSGMWIAGIAGVVVVAILGIAFVMYRKKKA